MIHKPWSATLIIILAAHAVNHFCIFINIYRDIISPILCVERRWGAIFITETQNYTRLVRKVDQTFRWSLPMVFQSDFRTCFSTEMPLVKTINDLLTADRGDCLVLVLLDLNAAFNMFSHSRNLDRSCNWLHSYLSNRASCNSRL